MYMSYSFTGTNDSFLIQDSIYAQRFFSQCSSVKTSDVPRTVPYIIPQETTGTTTTSKGEGHVIEELALTS